MKFPFSIRAQIFLGAVLACSFPPAANAGLVLTLSPGASPNLVNIQATTTGSYTTPVASVGNPNVSVIAMVDDGSVATPGAWTVYAPLGSNLSTWSGQDWVQNSGINETLLMSAGFLTIDYGNGFSQSVNQFSFRSDDLLGMVSVPPLPQSTYPHNHPAGSTVSWSGSAVIDLQQNGGGLTFANAFNPGSYTSSQFGLSTDINVIPEPPATAVLLATGLVWSPTRRRRRGRFTPR